MVIWGHHTNYRMRCGYRRDAMIHGRDSRHRPSGVSVCGLGFSPVSVRDAQGNSTALMAD